MNQLDKSFYMMPKRDLINLLAQVIRQRDFAQKTIERLEEHLKKSEEIRENQCQKLEDIGKQYEKLHSELTDTILHTNYDFDLDNIDLDYSPPNSPTNAALELKNSVIDLTDED